MFVSVTVVSDQHLKVLWSPCKLRLNPSICSLMSSPLIATPLLWTWKSRGKILEAWPPTKREEGMGSHEHCMPA